MTVPNIFVPGGIVASAAINENFAALATTADLAATTGASLVGLTQGGTVQQAITYVTPEMFGAVGDGATDATAALQAMIDYCYNSGNVRAEVYLPGNKNYLVSDPNADGYCLLLPDGVKVTGASAATSTIKTTTAGVMILRRYRTGTARQGFLRDFCLDGTNVAKGCLELFGSAYDATGGVLRCQNALRPVVVDGSQNVTLRGILVSNAGQWGYSILNGAGTVELDNCYCRNARYGHILIDNDPSYPGYQLGPAGGSNPLAYATPTAISVRGGIYEDSSATYPTDFKTSLRINTGGRVLVYGNTVLAIQAASSECFIDDGRWSQAGTYVNDTSFTVSSADLRTYFPVGRRILMFDSSAASYSRGYGVSMVVAGDPTKFTVTGDQTAVFTASKRVRIVKSDGTSVDATVSSSSYSTFTTVTLSTAVVPATIISVQVGYVYGVVASTSFSTNTTVNLTVDSGWVVPSGAFNLEIGRSDDGSTSFWYPTVNGTHIRDVTLGIAGSASFSNSAVRSGAYQSIYDGVTLSGLLGDWFEISQQVSVVKPFGSLTVSSVPATLANVVITGNATVFTATYVSASSFTVTGDQTGLFTPGAGLKLTDGSGNIVYMTVTSSTFGANTTVTASGKLRTRHLKGIFSGFAQISYTPNQQANSGTFELPGHASALVYSTTSNTWRWVDNTGTWRFVTLIGNGTVAPTFNASHIGQRWINTATNKEYVATATGTGASDWQILN
jgi:hypothetical protein